MVNRVLLFGSMVLLMIVVIVGVFAPDLPLYLRTQIAAQFANPASLTKTFTWTPTNDDLGEKTLTIVATDDNGNTTTKEVTVNVVEKPVGITNVQVAVEDTQATMTWETASTFLAAVEFDVNSNLRERQDASSQTPALTHSVVLSNLRPCTTYTYRVVAVDATIGDTPDITRNFTTTGCTGGAVVTGTTQADISTSGGEVSLPDKITVQVPSGAIGQDATFQVHQLNRDTALASIGSPDSLSPVTGLYQLGAFSNVSTSVDTFSEPVQVTLHYTPASDTNISTLKIARYDGSSWQDLSDCSVDEGNQTVTCATTAFSAFAGFAAGSTSPDSDPEPSPTPPPSDNNDNHSGGGGGGGGSGGGGGGSGGGDSGRPEKRNTTVTYQVESGHKIEGSFSGIVRDGSQVVAKLAHEKSLLSKSVSVPKNDYWLDVRVKHDRPGPVDMAIYINNTAWKVIRLPRADNKYYVHRIGLLRNFRGATVRFRMLHDDFAKNDPTNEELDRNLYIDWWRLTTDSHISTSGSATGTTTARQAASKPVAGGRSAGWALLPHLNDYIREELGSQNVKLATWKYYAWRLTVPTNNRASIQTDTHLRTVMRYWKGASPAKPYGETF